jgi:hypothetical protein
LATINLWRGQRAAPILLATKNTMILSILAPPSAQRETRVASAISLVVVLLTLGVARWWPGGLQVGLRHQ